MDRKPLRVAVSNIASIDGASPRFLGSLRDEGVEGLEVAPSKESLLTPPTSKVATRQFKMTVAREQLNIVSLHSLTYRLTETTLFGSIDQRTKLRSHLVNLARLSHDLECPIMIFGSPSARQRGQLPVHQATEIAIDFFRDLTTILENLGVRLALEALEPSLSNFLNSFAECKAINDAVKSPALDLHVDLRAALHSSESIPAIFESLGAEISHVHLSGPRMTLPDINQPNIRAALASISASKYEGYLSLEVPHEHIPDGASLQTVIRSISTIHSEV